MKPAPWLRWFCWLACLVLAGSVAWQLHQQQQAMLLEGKKEAEQRGQATADALEASLEEISEQAHTIAAKLVDEGVDCFSMTTNDALMHALESNDALDSALVAFAPDRSGCHWSRGLQGLMGGPLTPEEPGAATSKRDAWFHEALEANEPGWFEPHWNEREVLEVGYAVPFELPDDGGEGVLALVLSLESLAGLEALDLGSKGFVVVLDSQRRHLVHHNPKLTISGDTMREWATKGQNGPLLELADRMERENTVVSELRFSSTGQRSWVCGHHLGSPDWWVHVLLPQEELFLYQSLIQRKAELILALGMLAIATLVALFGGGRGLGRHHGAWVISAGSALCLAACIGFFWQLASTQHGFDEDRMKRIREPVTESSGVDDPVLVPTGVFLQSLEFHSANNVHVTGYVWQKYGEDQADLSQGFVLPEAIEPAIEEAYQLPCGVEPDCVVKGWYVSAMLRQPFDYHRYPFDQKAVWLRLWHQDFASSAVLVPRLDDYGPQIPITRPGVEQNLVPEGWNLQGSFFGYRGHDYNTDFGIRDYVGQDGFPELHYTVLLQRNFVDAFISHLVPLLVVASLLFTILLQGVRDRLSSTDLVGICSGLFFVVLLSHTALREDLATPDVVYLEYFYLLMYLFILAVTVLSVTWAIVGEGSRLLAWARPLRLSYWPALLGCYLVVTWIMLGPG